MNDRCPKCGGGPIITGRFPAEGFGRFRPDGLRFLLIFSSPSVRCTSAASACLSCGHAWTAIDPAKLCAIIARGGTDKAKELLAHVREG